MKTVLKILLVFCSITQFALAQNDHLASGSGLSCFAQSFDAAIEDAQLQEAKVSTFSGKHFEAILLPKEVKAWLPSQSKLSQLDPKFKKLLARDYFLEPKLKSNLRKELIDSEICEDECAALKVFLLRKDRSMSSLELVNHLSFKNDVLQKLITRDQDCDIGWLMIAILKDKKHNPLWREYVLQHVPVFYQSRWPTRGKSDVDLELRSALQTVLVACLFDQEPSVSGTALIVLSDLSQHYTEFDQGRIRIAANNMFSNESISPCNQIAAFHCLSAMPESDDAATALNAINDASRCNYVKRAAIGLLCHLAEEDESVVQTIESLSQEEGRSALVADALSEAQSTIERNKANTIAVGNGGETYED